MAKIINIWINEQEYSQLNEMLNLRDELGYKLFKNRSQMIKSAITLLAQKHKDKLMRMRGIEIDKSI